MLTCIYAGIFACLTFFKSGLKKHKIVIIHLLLIALFYFFKDNLLL